MLRNVVGFPWCPMLQSGTFEEHAVADVPPIEPARRIPQEEVPPPLHPAGDPPWRRMYITRRDVEKHGYTADCQGCRALQLKLRSQTHSEACRRRMIKAMADDPEGAERLAQRAERDKEVAEELSQHRVKRHRTEDARGGGEPLPEDKADDKNTHKRKPDNDDIEEERLQDREGDVIENAPNVQYGGSSSSGVNPQPQAAAAPAAANSQTPDAAADEDMNADEPPTKLPRTGETELSWIDESEWKIFELFSVPRVGKFAAEYGMTQGLAMDIKSKEDNVGPWNFLQPRERRRAMEEVRRQCPALVIGSPPCEMFSTLQNLNQEIPADVWNQRMHDARQLLEFAITVYWEQLLGGRYFVHEHPLAATSWRLPSVQRLAKEKGVYLVHADQCAYGQHLPGDEALVKKPTLFMTNSPELARILGDRCSGQHEHRTLLGGGRAKKAQVYPEGLCRAMCQGARLQRWMDLEQAEHDQPIQALSASQADYGVYFDDVTGAPLKTSLVEEARREEMEYVRGRKIYTKVPIQRCFEATGRQPVTLRWVDVNKGSEEMPNYRSRLVARELRRGAAQSPEYHAPTPPLEALKCLLALAAGRGRADTRVVHVDVRRAHFYADVRREVFVTIPAEDFAAGDEQMCAQLVKSMYGTRDAASNWERAYSDFLKRKGFVQGTACPNVFVHPSRGIPLVVHGDDFTAVVNSQQQEWFVSTMKQEFEVKVKVLGMGERCEREIVVLNRHIRVCSRGFEYEADVRHVPLLVDMLGLQGANGISAPGVAADARTREEAEQNKQRGPQDDASLYRQIAARANYIAADRFDLQYAVKEACRAMSSPGEGDWARLKKIGRYCIKYPRVIHEYLWNYQKETQVNVYTDSDYAGDRVTRKSTSGGAVVVNGSTVKSWAKTQSIIALSSGEAELYAAVRACSELFGVLNILKEMGVTAASTPRMFLDASAAVGIMSRAGTGATRHLDVNSLWIQQAVRSGRVIPQRIAGTENPADLGTKYREGTAFDELFAKIGLRRATVAKAIRHE